ncbi:MAG: cation diffusion facilitator family transporter, partial [Candidatus Cloacimonadota bacterium]|nr:cation diffusion facilitator family transporter [Candidatus Cloacimonadota bacterium]
MGKKTANKRTKMAYLASTISIVLNVLLFAIKFWVGLRTASVALVADAWHTLSDSFSSVIIYFGFKISSHGPDKDHPYGHGRMELIAAVIVGVILGVIGLNFLVESVQRYFNDQSANFGLAAILVTAFSALSKEGMAQFATITGKKYNSELLKADGWHHRSDALSSLLILAGILLGKYIWWIDSLLGIIVSLMIFYAAYKVLSKSINSLLGTKINDDFKDELEKFICNQFDFKIFLHHIHLHKYGDHKEMTFHIKLPASMSIGEGHRISEKLEKT